MAKKTENSDASKKTPKRRWYNNIIDAYKVTARSYTWLGWLLGGVAVVTIIVAVLLGVAFNSLLWTSIIGVMLASLFVMVVLSSLLRPAMYKQLDGTVGSVYSVISQIKRGWVVAEEPVQVTKDQDIVWRLVGRPGVVLISEGPSSRVVPLMQNERKRVNRIVTNVPVTFIQYGHGDGQIELGKINRRLRGLKSVLTKQEVPAVSARLNAVGSRALPIPKGIDPNNTKSSRRAMRGK